MAIEVGDTAPDFELESTDGSLFKLSEEIKKHPVMLNFYVGDFGIRCTDYMNVFNERIDELTSLGVGFVGINDCGMDSHKGFRDRLALKWELLEDRGRKVATEYGSLVGPGHMTTGMTNREFYLVGNDMKVLFKWRSSVPKELPTFEEILEGAKSQI